MPSTAPKRPPSLLITTGVLLLLLLIVAGLCVLGYGYFYADRIFPGVSVQQVPVGGLTRVEAVQALHQALEQQELPYVRLQSDQQAWIFSTTSLGGSLDVASAANQAWELGRGGVFRQDLVTRARLLWRGYDLVPDFRLEPGLSLAPLRQIALQTGSAPRRAQVWVAGLDVNNTDARTGRDLDIAAAQVAISQAVDKALGDSAWNTELRWRQLLHADAPRTGHFPAEPIPVDLRYVDLNPGASALSEAHAQAAILLSAPVTLWYDEPAAEAEGGTVRRTWSIDRAELASWLVESDSSEDQASAVTLDRGRMQALVTEIAAAIDRPARQGRLDYDAAAGTLVSIRPEQMGRTLDQARTLSLLETACLSASGRSVQLPVTVSEPAVTRAELEALLPLELISTGETGFVGANEARIHNISEAAERFRGIVVAPNSRFSFVEHVGDVTIAQGYTEGWVIVGDETVLGPGGGVCQVSTTFFRAAFWGGYPIADRTPHAYRVSWYEPPLGLDAAVFTPYVDLKFDNDQDTPILIQPEVDRANGKLYFRFYGRPTGRTVQMEGPVITATLPPGEPVIELDPSLAPGERIQTETAREGADVTVFRLIEVDGRMVAREPFISRYEPWSAHYREGPPATP
ncbi:MAG: VanW family protein [Anaerolineae bacterium]|jgi:vancomycin resistance protein YoaR|nr:hypothetical protein [Chloroflexota bacterium]